MTNIKERTNSMILSNLLMMLNDTSCPADYTMYLHHAVSLKNRIQKQKRKQRYQHIMFDLDGTLIDTEESILETWQTTLSEYQYAVSLEDLHVVIGITTRSALEKLNIHVDETFETRWIQNYRAVANEIMFFDKVQEMLKNLKQLGYQLGVVTSRCRSELNDYFRFLHLDTIFDYIVCADDSEYHKPHPQPLYKYMELANIGPESCMYIGDMPTDIECANQAGITSGLVLWNRCGVLCDEATYMFRTPKDLFDIVM